MYLNRIMAPNSAPPGLAPSVFVVQSALPNALRDSCGYGDNAKNGAMAEAIDGHSFFVNRSCVSCVFGLLSLSLSPLAFFRSFFFPPFLVFFCSGSQHPASDYPGGTGRIDGDGDINCS